MTILSLGKLYVLLIIIALKDWARQGYCVGMSHKPNPKQLVLRRDTATGMTLVGWDEDLPVGRFEHLELICESANNNMPEYDTKGFASYQLALHNARQANQRIVEQQVRHYKSKGWILVPFELSHDHEAMKADSMGNFSAAAMKLHYQLIKNRKRAWAVIQRDSVVHVRARHPQKKLDELTYQVWYYKQLNELNELGGMLLEGHLIICESGLWFEAKNDHSL